MGTGFLERGSCDLECPECIISKKKVQEVLFPTKHTKKLRYDDHEIIFKRGEPVISFYIICKGVLREISFAGPDEEITLRVFKKGDILFSDSFFTQKGFYSTTTETVTPVEVIFLRKDVLPELMGVSGRGVGKSIAENMVNLRESLEISSYPILVQVAYWLIKLTQDLSSDCSVSNKRLARIIGCSPVTLSEKLGWLEERRLIVREGQKITIPDNRKLLEGVTESGDLVELLEHYLKG